MSRILWLSRRNPILKIDFLFCFGGIFSPEFDIENRSSFSSVWGFGSVSIIEIYQPFLCLGGILFVEFDIENLSSFSVSEVLWLSQRNSILLKIYPSPDTLWLSQCIIENLSTFSSVSKASFGSVGGRGSKKRGDGFVRGRCTIFPLSLSLFPFPFFSCTSFVSVLLFLFSGIVSSFFLGVFS